MGSLKGLECIEFRARVVAATSVVSAALIGSQLIDNTRRNVNKQLEILGHSARPKLTHHRLVLSRSVSKQDLTLAESD